jgi:hypothetical protein
MLLVKRGLLLKDRALRLEGGVPRVRSVSCRTSWRNGCKRMRMEASLGGPWKTEREVVRDPE